MAQDNSKVPRPVDGKRRSGSEHGESLQARRPSPKQLFVKSLLPAILPGPSVWAATVVDMVPRSEIQTTAVAEIAVHGHHPVNVQPLESTVAASEIETQHFAWPSHRALQHFVVFVVQLIIIGDAIICVVCSAAAKIISTFQHSRSPYNNSPPSCYHLGEGSELKSDAKACLNPKVPVMTHSGAECPVSTCIRAPTGQSVS